MFKQRESTATRQSTDSRHCEFALESLEDRRMLAGDVSVNVTNSGNLVVNGGGGEDNGVVIEATDVAGQFRIRGINNTTINDQNGPVTVNGVTNDLRINLRSGDNQLLLVHEDGSASEFEVTERVRIRTGGDDDAIVLMNVNAGEVNLATRGGSDAVTVFGGQIEDVSMNMGGAADALILSYVELGELDVSMGGGDDGYIQVQTTVLNKVDVGLGGGDDVAGLYQSEYAPGTVIEVDGDGGFDRVEEFGNTFAADLDDIEDEFDGGVAQLANELRANVPSLDDAIGLVQLGL